MRCSVCVTIAIEIAQVDSLRSGITNTCSEVGFVICILSAVPTRRSKKDGAPRCKMKAPMALDMR
ncbi:hypothetical protein SFRURICE_016714 [Spodoptera frugiperda]|nr:hypothetical protein SFRURICE_016714 [Spodoptera frugiperda]